MCAFRSAVAGATLLAAAAVLFCAAAVSSGTRQLSEQDSSYSLQDSSEEEQQVWARIRDDQEAKTSSDTAARDFRETSLYLGKRGNGDLGYRDRGRELPLEPPGFRRQSVVAGEVLDKDAVLAMLQGTRASASPGNGQQPRKKPKKNGSAFALQEFRPSTKKAVANTHRSFHGSAYDVPVIECPIIDQVERVPCPSPNRKNRYKCIEIRKLCDGFKDCIHGEDEDLKACMFYKSTKIHIDVLADAILRWTRGRR